MNSRFSTLMIATVFLASCGNRETPSSEASTNTQTINQVAEKIFSVTNNPTHSIVDGYKEIKFGMLPLDVLKIAVCQTKEDKLEEEATELKQKISLYIDNGAPESTLKELKSKLDVLTDPNRNRALATEGLECDTTFMGQASSMNVTFNKDTFKAEGIHVRSEFSRNVIKDAIEALDKKYTLIEQPTPEDLYAFDQSDRAGLTWKFSGGQVAAQAAKVRFPGAVNAITAFTISYLSKDLVNKGVQQKEQRHNDL